MATRDDVHFLEDSFWDKFFALHSQPYIKNYVTDRLIIWEPAFPVTFALDDAPASGGATAWVG